MITHEDYKIIETRCTYNDKGNHDIEYVVIEYQGKLYIGQSNKSQHGALNNAIKSIDKDKLLELYQEKEQLQNYHYIVTEKQSSLDKSKINKEFADEMKKYKELSKQIKALAEELK